MKLYFAAVFACVVHSSYAWVHYSADTVNGGQATLQQRRAALKARRVELLDMLSRLEEEHHGQAFASDWAEQADVPWCKYWECGRYRRGKPCQCNSECERYGNCCTNYAQSCVQSAPATSPPTPPAPPFDTNGTTPCLCVFDIDRTLTAGQREHCPRAHKTRGYIYDNAYGGGPLQMSEVGNDLRKSQCNKCFVGLVSRGDAGGHNSKMREHILNNVIQTDTFKPFLQHAPNALKWSDWKVNCVKRVSSPFLIRSPNNCKKYGVEAIRQWYAQHGVSVAKQDVFFYDDHSSNIPQFRNFGFNAFEIGCDRPRGKHTSTCGAIMDEIRLERLSKGYKMCGHDYYR